jgi:hypothetical protein
MYTTWKGSSDDIILILKMTPVALLLVMVVLLTSQISYGLVPICTNIVRHGCVRYVAGFDITGVTTEVDLKFPQVKNVCDCLKECVKRKTTCVNFVSRKECFWGKQSVTNHRIVLWIMGYRSSNLPMQTRTIVRALCIPISTFHLMSRLNTMWQIPWIFSYCKLRTIHKEEDSFQSALDQIIKAMIRIASRVQFGFLITVVGNIPSSVEIV